jgi:hypothetical protein
MSKVIETPPEQRRPEQPNIPWRGRLVTLLVVVALISATVSYIVGLSHSQSKVVITPAPTANPASACAVTSSPWTPVGKIWHLTVKFLSGARQNQSQVQLMTFLSDGTLTTTFPGATPFAPPTLPPGEDGHWCFTGQNTFHYIFHDPLGQGMYVQPSISAFMTTPNHYEAAGVGVAYDKSGRPIPGQYGVTQTIANAA